MIELMIQYTGGDVAISQDSFMKITEPAYKLKSWILTRLFFGSIDALKKNTETGVFEFNAKNHKIFTSCHKSNLRIYAFLNTSKDEWAPHWNPDQQILMFPINAPRKKLNDEVMGLIGQAVRDVVPEYVETEVWHTQDQMRAEIDKFHEYMIGLGFCSRESLDTYSKSIADKVAAIVRVEEQRLSDHLSIKDVSDIPHTGVNMEAIDRVSEFYAIYRDMIKRLGEYTDQYDFKGFEDQSAMIFAPLNAKSVGKERELAYMGIKWHNAKEGTGKIARSYIHASTIPSDFMWALSPAKPGEERSSLLEPTVENKHANVIKPFKEDTRTASVLVGMLVFACGWDPPMRMKSMMDSKAVHVIRAIILEAINNIPKEDVLRTHLQDEKKPRVENLPMEDIVESMYTWSKALMIGYAKYNKAMSEIIVGLQSREPDGQKKKWSQSEAVGDIAGTLISTEMEPGEGTLLFADKVEFTDSLYIMGNKCLRVTLKPTIIMYEDRLYSMGRYQIEINIRKKNPIRDSFLSTDFLSEEIVGGGANSTMAPVPRNPSDNSRINSMMHSHVNCQGYSAQDSIRQIICLGGMETRYENAAKNNPNRNRGTKIPISVDHVFDGAPDHITVNSVNPTALINTIARLLSSCYQHNDGHSNLGMGNWPNCRIN